MSLAGQLSAAFEAGAHENSWIAAQSRLRDLDPLVRLVARRRFAKVLERARRSTTLDDPAHVLRLAAVLAVKPNANCAFDDPASVSAELVALGPRSIAKQAPWWTLGVCVLAVAVTVSALFVRRALAPFDPRVTPAGRVLGEGLTGFVAALNHGPRDANALAQARTATTGSDARRAFGDEGVARLARVLGDAETVAQSEPAEARSARSVVGSEPRVAAGSRGLLARGTGLRRLLAQ